MRRFRTHRCEQSAKGERQVLAKRERHEFDMVVSKNRGGYPQIIHLFIGFSITNNPFWGTPILGITHILMG